MSDDIRKFFDTASTDPAFAGKIQAALAQIEGGTETLSQLAAEKNFTISAADFRDHAGELSLDQLDTVAGGNMVNMRNNRSPFDE